VAQVPVAHARRVHHVCQALGELARDVSRRVGDCRRGERGDEEKPRYRVDPVVTVAVSGVGGVANGSHALRHVDTVGLFPRDGALHLRVTEVPGEALRKGRDVVVD
jgi:hypothetical protein